MDTHDLTRKLQVKNDSKIVMLVADGLGGRKGVRTLQADYAIASVGAILDTLSRSESETKYQRAIKITERLVTLGCSKNDDLPYFKA